MCRCVDVWVEGNRPIKGGLFESNMLIRCHSTTQRLDHEENAPNLDRN